MLWGYRFANLLTFKHSASEYKIDYSAFNSVYKVDLSPLCQKVKDELSDGDKHINDGSDEGDEEDEEDQETKCTKSPPSGVCQCQQTTSLSPLPPTPTSNHLLPPSPYPAPLARAGGGEPGKKYCVEILHMV